MLWCIAIGRRVSRGRDWFDFEWSIRNNVPINFAHLQERIREFSGQVVSKEEYMLLLRERLATADINLVKQDVITFVDRPSELDIWSSDYFLQIAEMIRFV